MQTNIIWTGKFYNSIENCLLKETTTGNEIKSTIIGDYKKKIYKVEYYIRTNTKWQTKSVTLFSEFDNSNEFLTLKNKNGKWFLNSKLIKDYKNIFDIDISLTPFTNTLPINRLKLKNNQRQVIDVLHFDILAKQVKPVKQIYTRLKANNYIFENYDKSFKANLEIDKQGLVVNYPKLFEMTIKHESKYP